MKKKNTAHIIPHTHWDREWRYPIWKNRMLLIEFMDTLLHTLDTDPAYKCFLLDGQIAPIEDYLEVMPHERARVTQYIQEGRIAVGPWYTLPDLYPLDGECLVRNLLKGIRTTQQYGDFLRVGYNSFGWGQTAQFPQIYAGFGMDFIICAKKVSEDRAPQSEFMWEAPDGTRILASRLGQHARANFYFNAFLFSKYGFNCTSEAFRYSPEISGIAVHHADAAQRDEDFFMLKPHTAYRKDWLTQGMQDAWKATDATACKNNRLFLNGTDFSTPHPELSSVLRDLNESNPDTVYVNGRLEDYAAALHASLDPATLKTIKGELRDGPAGECSGNALSSRIYLKMLNKKAQNLLLHKAEPLCAAAEMSGTPLPKSFTDRGWKYLLQAHPHDSINGVTQDKTANDVEYRLAQAIEIGEVAADKAVHTILDQIDFSGYEGADSILVVVNPLPFPVQDVLKVCVAVPRSEGIWSFCA